MLEYFTLTDLKIFFQLFSYIYTSIFHRFFILYFPQKSGIKTFIPHAENKVIIMGKVLDLNTVKLFQLSF